MPRRAKLVARLSSMNLAAGVVFAHLVSCKATYDGGFADRGGTNGASGSVATGGTAGTSSQGGMAGGGRGGTAGGVSSGAGGKDSVGSSGESPGDSGGPSSGGSGRAASGGSAGGGASGGTAGHDLPGSAGADDAGATGGSNPSSSSGCGTPQTGTSSYAVRSIAIRGTEREYYLWVPTGYDATRPYPLIVRFHGSTGDGLSGGLEIEAAAAGNAIIASPSGIDGHWDLAPDGVDVALFDAILLEVEDSYCIDAGRVFAYGFSAGGALTNLLGCVRGNVLRGIAPVESSAPMLSSCNGPVAAWFTHSPDDTVVTIDRGAAALELYRSLDGCGTDTAPVAPTPCVRYQSCTQGFPVDWCETSGPHDPQGSFTAPGAWSFFSSLP
jgi:polyhydroxybutyrate depolymerase